MYKKILIVSVICISFPIVAELSYYEKKQLSTIPFYGVVEHEVESLFDDVVPYEYVETIVQSNTTSNPLFTEYPALSYNLSYISLGDLPTPIHYCQNLSLQFPSTQLYIKHDGITGKMSENETRFFGGNKLRKLQYLLADALAHGHDSVITFGCVGSNHAAQTAVCAAQVGLHCYSMLKPQPNSHIVRRNLLLQKAYEATITISDTTGERAQATLGTCHNHKKQCGRIPYVIPTGGSIARGAIGYVQAAFELKQQIEAGILKKPDHIYVTLGSGGTAAGLLLGCKAAGIDTLFHCILDAPADKNKEWQRLQKLFHETNDLLISLDPTFPQCAFTEKDCCIVDAYTGTAYGLFTDACVEAIATVRENENITLDGVYSGKCMSALLADLKNGLLKNATVLFWNTFCAEDMSDITNNIDYRTLPVAAHVYFEQDVQPLDNQ